MIGIIRVMTLGVLALVCGFGFVYVVFTYYPHLAPQITARVGAPANDVRHAEATRHYVINLVASEKPIAMATVQHPDALARYQVYSTRVKVDKTARYQLRLGFFEDAAAAKKVADSLRVDFPQAKVAQASAREWSERANATIVALVAARSSADAAGKMTGKRQKKPKDEASTPAPAASAVQVAMSPRATAQSGGQASLTVTATRCDELTAHPWDPKKLTEGVYWNQVPAARAVVACRKAVRNDPSPRNMFQYGRALAKAKEFEDAAEWYLKSASQGYVQAQYALGDIYEFGEGVELDYVTAQRWYKKAADQGYSHALSKLSRLAKANITDTRRQMADADISRTTTQ